MTAKVDPHNLNSLALAYMGDSVYEAYIREKMLATQTVKVNQLHRLAISWVKASAQAQLARRLELLLTEEELDILRRGRNAKSGHVPKNADVADYRLATGFEAIIGYLYLDGQQGRLYALLDEITKEEL
ncbi:MAG: Mini-ribonuclease 3 [Bacillota bacterium]